MPEVFGSGRGNLRASGGGGGNGGYIRISPGGLGFPVIFRQFSAQLQEKIQVLETFKEFIHIYAFGKGAGRATLSGSILSCGGGPPNANKVANAYQNSLRARALAKSGSLATISGPGSFVVRGVIDSMSISIAAETHNMADFTLNMIIASSVSGAGGGGGSSGGGGGGIAAGGVGIQGI